MSDILQVEARESLGTAASRRLRDEGKVPAVLYGHGEDSVSLTLCAKSLGKVLNHGGHVVKLEGAVAQSALIKDLQWDTFGSYVLHVDLMRVDADERIDVAVAVELKGDAPGAATGVIEQPVRELTLKCSATDVPEKVVVNIGSLNIGDSITAGQVELPSGAELAVEPELLVVHCVGASGVAAESDATEEATEE